MKLVCKCWVPSFYQRITACAFLFLVLNRVTCARQEIRQHCFNELLEIVKSGDIRERRDATEEEEESSGVDPDNEGAPEIMISEQKKFVVRRQSKIEVDVGSTVYAVRETHITVWCKASAEGQTQPKVKWLRYDRPMTGRFQGDVAAVNGKLIIRRLGRFNEGSYTCRASNSNGSDEAIFSAKILVPTLPTILTVNEDLQFGPSDKEAEITVGSNATVYRGTTLTIRCPVVGTGNPVIFWTSKDKSVSIGKAVKVGNDLVINDIDRRYALDYKCTARAPRGRVSATSTVNVLALDPPRIKGGKKVLKVLEDENIKVTIDVGSNLTAISETQVIVRCVVSMKPSPALSWKVQQTKTLSLSEDNTTLTITDPLVEDTGLYTCVASNNIGQDSKTSYIQILPPEPPRISYSNRMVTQLRESDALQTTIGDQVTMLAGGTVSIKCPTFGLPSPTVKWSKDGEELTNGPNVTYAESESSLKINNATTRDSGVFTCEAVNRAGRFSYSSTLKIIAAEKPEIQSSSGRVLGLQGIEEAFVKIGEDLRVVEGLIVRLVCPVTGFPTPQVKWLMNGEKVETTERFLIDWRTNSLVINGIELQETGQVSCLAENIAGRAEEASFISILSESSAQVLAGNRSVVSIKDVKPITIQIGDRLRVLSSSNVFIDCSARGTPPPVVNWRRDGRTVRTGDREGQFVIRDTSDGSRLSIWQISEEVAGQYECVATNLGGADRVASVITVLEGSPPKIEFSSKSKTYLENLDPVSVLVGSRVTLLPGVVLEITCTASGVPEPVIGWFKQGKPITSRGRFISHGRVLIINSTRPQDNGVYTCAAENSLGMDTFDSIVAVIKPVEPTITETGQDMVVGLASRLSQVVGGNILSIEGVDLEITCSVQGRPIPEVTWMRGNEVIGKGRILRLGIVKEQNTGNYSCVATNVGGKDKKTTKLTVKKAVPPKIQRGLTTVESFEEQVMITVDVGTRLRVTQGASINLVCRVTGFPTPRVSWVIGNQPLDERLERQGFYTAEFNGTSTTLFVRGARTSQDEVYGCTASSTGGTASAYSYVKFYERTPPTVESTWLTGSVGIRESLKNREPITITIGDTLRLFTKTQVTIKCPVYAVPVARVEWTKDKRSLLEKHQTNGTNLVLSKESDLSDSGRYSCTATNGMGKDSSWSDVTFIEPTPPSIFVGDSSVQLFSPVNYRARVGSNITTMEGNNITLVCESEGVPTPTVSWEKDGVALNFTETMYTVFASSVKLSGSFSCVAKNLGGYIVSTSNLEVLDDILKVIATAPRIITSRKNQPNPDDRRTVEQIIGGNVTVLEGRNLLLRCPVEGIPDPDVTWLFDGSPVQVSDTVQIDSETGHLKIIEMTEDDVGQYSCIAKNIAGETTEISYTAVIEPTFPVIESSNVSIEWLDPSRKPLTVKVGGNVVTLVGTTVSITCRVSGLPQPKTSWVKDLTGFADNNIERMTGDGDQITLRDPTESDSGLYMCTASSPGGETSEVTNITFVSSVRPKILFSTREQQILERRTVNITIGEKLTILDQSNVTLECIAIGVPSPAISWRKNNLPLPSGVNVWVIRNILPEDAGLYQCTAKNFLGADSQSSEISVAVGRQPTITSKRKNFVKLDKLASIELDIGSNLTFISVSRLVLLCQADGTPTPTITWKLNGVPLEENTNESTLILEDIALDDLKTTSCAASNVLGSASKASFLVQMEPSKPLVEIPVSPRAIESQGGNPVTMSIGNNVTAFCNTTVTIECTTSGIPEPTVIWTKDGKEILNDTTYTIRNDGSLVIYGACVKKSARYTCFADSSFGRDSAESSVTFVEPVKPSVKIPETGRQLPIGDGSPVTMNIGDNVTAASETRITIKCPVDGLPKPRVTWNKDGVQITSGEKFLITDDNSLVIEEASVEDSAMYTCKIENVAGTDSASSSVVIEGRSKPVVNLPSTPRTVDGQDGNPVTMTIGDNVTALSNTSITIECPTSGVPQPTVTWKKDGQEIFSEARYTIREDGSLVIGGANVEDSALYTCTAESDAGRDNASSMVQIVEPVKPSVKMPETGRQLPIGDGSPVTMNIGDNVTAASETRITIKCPVDGLPKPRVTWNKDGVQITSGEKFLITDDNSLVIEEASVEDSAMYTCKIENVAGTDSASSSVVFEEPTQPRIAASSGNVESLKQDPVNITVGQNLLTLTESELSISCPVRGLPLPKVIWKKGNETLPFDGRMAIRNHTLFIVELESSDTGTYTCYAENAVGTAAASSNLTVEAPFPLEIVRTKVEDLRVLVATSIDASVGSSILTIRGNNVTLFCEVNGFPPPLINWLKDNSPLDVKGRFLGLPSVTAEDSGLYKCVATSPLGFNDSLTANLTVIDLRRPTIVTNKDELEVFKMEDVSTAVGGLVSTLHGNRVSLRCEVSGIPNPRITWKKDDIDVQSGGNEYVIDRARRNDSGIYTCIATNVAGTEVAATNLSVIVGSAPRIAASQHDITIMDIDLFTITIGSNLTTLASSALEIECPVTGFPQPLIKWYREGALVHPGLMLKVDNTTGTLTALSVSRRKGGTFTCKASNVLGSANASSVVTVLAAVEPQISVSDGKVFSRDRNPVSAVIGVVLAVLNGTRVSIECTANGVPRPAIRWSHDNKPLNSSERILIQESTLTINDVTTEDNGVYLCNAVNIAGDDIASSILNVTASSPPRISSTNRPQAMLSSGAFTVAIGSSVTTVAGNTLSVRCKAAGVPSPDISWTKDGSMIDVKGQLLNIRALNLSDTGLYQCIASNIDGTDVQELNLEVLAATAPRIISPEENIMAVDGVKDIRADVGGNITTITGSSVEIACVTTGLPNATVTWFFNGSLAEDEGFRSINPANKAVLVTSVTPSYTGIYTCIANNSIGSDSKSSFLSIIVPEEPKIIPSNKNITDFSTAEQTLSIGDNLNTLEGVTVTITCPHTGSPTPDIQWKKSGVVITTNSRFKVLNEALTINNARQLDTGSYTCTATNGAGSDEKATFLNFKVSEQPLITGDGIDIESYNREPLQVNVGGKLKVLENTLVKINCTASGIPAPAVYWYRDDNNRMNEEGSVLEFADIQVEDSGNYTCRAVNKAGEDASYSVIVVVAPIPPSILETTGNVSWYDKEPRSLSVGGNLEVLSGTNVTLQCESSGFPQPEVVWTLLDRENSTVKQNNRHQITYSSLVVYKARPVDSGLYLCTVRNLAGTSSVATRLSVIELRAPTITSSQEDIVSLSDSCVPVQAVVGSTITALIGSQVTVACLAEGIPSPTITWSRQNDTVFTLTQNKDKDQRGVLQIKDASVDDSGDYLCKAQSEAGIDMESTRIIIIEPSIPSIKQPEVDSAAVTNKSLVIVSVGSDVTVLTNTRVNITCEVDGVPSPNIRWLKDGEPTRLTDSSFLIITMITLQDAGQYTCVAENMAGNASLSSDIKVIEPLFPRILSGTGEVIALSKRQSVTGFVGVTVETFNTATLTLMCEAEGSPTPVVSWSKDGQLIVSKDRVSIQEDGTLIITNTHVGDSGTYQCSAKNVLGETVVESPVYIVAPIPPKIKVSKSYIIWYEKQQFKGRIGDNLTTMKGRMLTLICPAVGFPSPVIGWFRGGMRMTKGDNYHVNGQKLIIYNLDVTDTDRYTCIAKNIAGITSATSTLKVHEPMTPEIMSSFGSVDSLQDQRHLTLTIGTDATLLSGSPLAIKCPVVGVPEPKISWLKDNQVLFSNERMEIDCNGTLIIFATEIKDSGDYVCSADSFLGMDLAFSAVTVMESLTPSVDVSQRSLFISSGNLVDLHVGDNLTAIITTPVNLSCPARGVPKPSVSWRMNGNPLDTSGNYETDDNGVLVIRELTDPGQYTCIAENFLGKDDASSYITLLDTQTPVIEKSGRQIPLGDGSPVTMNIGDNVTAASETRITIKCPVDGLPKPRVTWNKDGVQITSGEKFLITDDNSLVIEGALVEDSAMYTCKIENVAGTDSASSFVVIEGRSKPVVNLPSTPRTVDGQDGNPVTMTIGDNVTALSNTSITIECPTSGVPQPTVTWKKDGQGIFSEARYTIREDGSLVIGGANVEDSALYTCTAESDVGRDNASSMVQIVEPVKPSVKIPEAGRELPIGDGSPVTMNIGDNVTAASETRITIKCPVDGLPKPRVTWNKDGVQITSGERFLITDDNSLVIEEASVEDSAMYTCKIENVAGTDSASSSVKIVVVERPTIVVPLPGPGLFFGDGSPVKTTVGSRISEFAYVDISLTCPTEGSPPPRVSWLKDGKELFSGGRIMIDKSDTLTIRDAVVQDSGKYTCVARNIAGAAEVESSITILEPQAPIIAEPPIGKVISDDYRVVKASVGTNIDAFRGATIEITCLVRGVPKPEVNWSKDNQRVLTGERILVLSNGTLIIRDSDLDDSGEYTCSANSSVGRDNATSALLITAPSKPVIQKSVEEIIWNNVSALSAAVGSSVEIFNGSSVVLMCNSSGHPPPQLNWTRGLEDLPSNGSFIISGHSLTITNVQLEDADEYTCTATNQFGQDSATTELVIRVPEQPVILFEKRDLVDMDTSRPIDVTIGSSLITVVNATVVINCTSLGTPKPITSWGYGQKSLVPGIKYNMTGSLLIMNRVQHRDGGRYKCEASSSFGSDWEYFNLTVTVPPVINNVKGTFEIIDIRDLVSITTGAVVTIPIGVSVKIQCVANGFPLPKITWYRQPEGSNQRDLVTSSSTVRILDDNSISISHTEVADAAEYICVAANIAGRDEGTTFLNIGTPPAIPVRWRGIQSRFREIAAGRLDTSIGAVASVIRGATLNIKCAAVGNPKPQITWTVATAGRLQRYRVLADGTLEVPRAELDDEGNYTCIANNSYGTLNRTTSVNILVPPEILERHFRHVIEEDVLDSRPVTQMEVKRNETSSVTIERGNNLILICTVRGRPKPQVTWRKNRTLIRNDTRHLILPKGALLVHRVDMEESGQYKCVASNIAGKDQGTVELVVKDKVVGRWKALRWSECGSCFAILSGWQERTISCVDQSGNPISNSHCADVPKPIAKRPCTSSNCVVIWWSSPWSACSMTCGSRGIKLRNVKCVFVKSLQPANKLCDSSKKPPWRGECNRISCKGNCEDRVKYCGRVKRMGLCRVYARWCCRTC